MIYSLDWFKDEGNYFSINLKEYNQILLEEIGYCDHLGSFTYTTA